jgi:hypothetical protein
VDLLVTEWIPPEHREIHEFLLHWGRWLQAHPIQGHCASIEHRFRSPQCWDERNPRPPEPDLARAMLIEGLMRIVPRVTRKILKLKYVHRADPEFIARRLRFHVKPHERYEQELYTARQIVLNLTRHALAPTVHGRFHNLVLSDYLVEAAA